MDVLPSNIIFDIFSRIPVKCLARLRCVSKLWRDYIDDPYLGIIHRKLVVEEPTFIMFHNKNCRTLCFHMIDSVDTLTLKPKKKPDLGFVGKKPFSTCQDFVVGVQLRGCCNGLLVVSQVDRNLKVVTGITVIHPLKKLCYKLPDLPSPLYLESHLMREGFGLGFDASTNTLKMVCVLFRQKRVPSMKTNPDLVLSILCTMVHEFGSNSWREIPRVPLCPINCEFVFTDGCLYWLASRVDSTSVSEEGGREVIWFDVKKEEFGLINPPTKIGYPYTRRYSRGHDHLVDLDGQLGYVCNSKVWVLSSKKEWILHICINLDLPTNGYIWVLGCRNKERDVLIKLVTRTDRQGEVFYVYRLKSGDLREADIAGITRRDFTWKTGIIMYSNTMCSIHQGIHTNSSCCIRKTRLRRSCRLLKS